MTTHRRPWARALLAITCLPTLSACVVAPVAPYGSYGYGNEAGEAIAVAGVPPPAPYYEVRPAMPYVGAVWIGGYWNWAGGRHVWAPGYWSAPRPGYAWRPYRWAPYGNRWNLYGGGWARGR